MKVIIPDTGLVAEVISINGDIVEVMYTEGGHGFWTAESFIELYDYWDESKKEEQRSKVRKERDSLIEGVMWRVERYESEARMGLTPSDDIDVLDTYIQDLRDITLQDGFPNEVIWPTKP